MLRWRALAIRGSEIMEQMLGSAAWNRCGARNIPASGPRFLQGHQLKWRRCELLRDGARYHLTEFQAARFWRIIERISIY